MTPLRKRMLEEMQIRNLAAGTQAVYLFQVAKFARHFGKPPDVLGWEQIRAYVRNRMPQRNSCTAQPPSGGDQRSADDR